MNTEHKQNEGHSTSSRLLAGLILIMAGFFLLLRNTGILPGFISNIIFTWQMLLIIIGFLIALGATNKTPGIIVMAVGGLFLLPSLFSNIFYNINMFWPAAFIVGGVLVLYSGRQVTGHIFRKTEGEYTDDSIDVINVFSGGERQVVSDHFSGGKVTAVFGGSEIDLTKSKLAPGVNELELTCVFGGTEIIIPPDWNVTIDVVPILGGFSDSRKITADRTIDNERKLIIKGTMIFGGGELKSY